MGGFTSQHRIHTSHTHISHNIQTIVLTHISLVSNSIGGSWGWRWVHDFHEERVSQAARHQRSVLCRVSARFSEAQQNCRSPRPRFEYALRAYQTSVGPDPGRVRPPPLCMFCLIPWPTQRSPALQWGRSRFHPFTYGYPEPYRHGISLRLAAREHRGARGPATRRGAARHEAYGFTLHDHQHQSQRSNASGGWGAVSVTCQGAQVDHKTPKLPHTGRQTERNFTRIMTHHGIHSSSIPTLSRVSSVSFSLIMHRVRPRPEQARGLPEPRRGEEGPGRCLLREPRREV